MAEPVELVSRCNALEARVVVLVQQAPELDRALIELAARDALSAAALASGELVGLALVIERVIDDLAEGEIALGVGLPAVAMAASTLQLAAVAGPAADPLAIRGAIYELETMTPVPATGRRPTIDEPRPDVPLSNLTSRLPAPPRRPDAAAAARAHRLTLIPLSADRTPSRLRYTR